MIRGERGGERERGCEGEGERGDGKKFDEKEKEGKCEKKKEWGGGRGN